MIAEPPAQIAVVPLTVSVSGVVQVGTV